MKSYKKDVAFLVAETLKDITNHTLKLAKVFLPPLKPMPHFLSIFPSILKWLILVTLDFFYKQLVYKQLYSIL